jgi:flagellar biosynthesis anti-sigma factor FlgM
MKVDNKIGPSVGKMDTGRAEKAVKNDGAGGLSKTSVLNAKSATKNANVDVSERAQMMSRAKDIASSQSVDEAKVARLQKLIDDGDYKTDANSIAERLLEEHMTIPD